MSAASPRVQAAFLVVLLSLCLSPASFAREKSVLPSLVPLKASGIYEVGETAGWTVRHSDVGRTRYDKYRYTIKKNNCELVKAGEIDLRTGPARIAVKIDEPAMLYTEVTPVPGEEGCRMLVAGAAVAPTQLRPVAPCPEDFDRFWRAKVEALKEVPENAVLSPEESGVAGIEYGTIRMDHLGGGHVYGQYAKPKGDGSFPALLILQWASPPYPLEKAWVLGHAADGWLVLNIQPHDVLPTEPASYYEALPDKLKHYEQVGRDDRNESYFLKMYLADYRAVDYLAHHPAWDGKTLVVLGTSMGGQQALCVAGLHPAITHLIVNVPAGCDLNAALHGRQAGYPFLPADDPRAMETARYFDAVNFAPSIRARSLVAMGFVDTTCPPAGIWTAFNQIPGPKETVPMPESPHNHLATPEQQAPYTRRSTEWLDSLVRGKEVLPAAEVDYGPAPTGDRRGTSGPNGDQPRRGRALQLAE